MTDPRKLVPKALLKLRIAGEEGMTRDDFFAACRNEDGVDSPLSVLKALYENGFVGYVEGSKPLRIEAL